MLKFDLRNEHVRARTNHWTGMTLMILAILVSAFAGLGGLTAKLGAQTVCAIALIPGAFALLSTTIKTSTAGPCGTTARNGNWMPFGGG
jgi:hypothetical protein